MLKRVMLNFLHQQDKCPTKVQSMTPHESLSREQLLILIEQLQSRLAILETEKASLRWLLASTTVGSNKVTTKLSAQSQKAWVWELDIDQKKREYQVAKIIQADYFQQLQAEINLLQYPDERDEMVNDEF